MSNNDQPCGGRDYCGRFPFCGCGRPELVPERDPAKTNAQQGVYRKFDVRRTDGSSEPGGKHHGCEYFVLDVTHDPHARAALAAYAAAVEATHPTLAADMRDRYGLAAHHRPAPAALLVRDIANDLGVSALDVCNALRLMGYGQHSVNMAITADAAAALTRHFGPAPQPAA